MSRPERAEASPLFGACRRFRHHFLFPFSLSEGQKFSHIFFFCSSSHASFVNVARFVCHFQPTTMHLACVNQRMSLSEAMAAATINAAHSIGRSETHGSIERGKFADLVIIKAPK